MIASGARTPSLVKDATLAPKSPNETLSALAMGSTFPRVGANCAASRLPSFTVLNSCSVAVAALIFSAPYAWIMEVTALATSLVCPSPTALALADDSKNIQGRTTS